MFNGYFLKRHLHLSAFMISNLIIFHLHPIKLLHLPNFSVDRHTKESYEKEQQASSNLYLHLSVKCGQN